jgi:hypothetical protein
MISFTLTVVYFSIMQDKLVSLLPHGTFTESFSVGVVTRDKVASADLTAFMVCQQTLILSAMINRTLILHHSLLPFTQVQDC